MELRKVDPRTLKFDPNNPRKTAPGALADDALVANIKAVGLLQPPVVREVNGDLEIKYGERRVRAVLRLNLEEIPVIVLDKNDNVDAFTEKEVGAGDDLRALSENVVRAPMNTVDLWRNVEKMTSQHWTQEAIASALGLTVRGIKQFRLFTRIHHSILDQFSAGDMPKLELLGTIASAPTDEQGSVWKRFKPNKGHSANWALIAQQLVKTRILASVAKFGPDEEEAFGIVWQEDLFTQGDQDPRYTTQIEAFCAAQHAWLETHLPKNGVLLSLDEFGHPKLPPKAVVIHTAPKKKDEKYGFSVNQRDGTVEKTAFRLAPPKPENQHPADSQESGESSPVTKKTRADITQKGTEIIGDLRTAALEKALLENPFDDVTLIGLLVLAFSATNISIRTGNYSSDDRNKILQSITEGGRLTQDLDILRRGARGMLASFLSSRPGMNDSGLVARLAGDVIGADQHLPNMATEEFLSCLSKAAVESAAASVSVLPQPRAKDTRAALIAQIGESAFIHPAAHFPLTEAEREKFENSLRTCRYYYGDTEETDNQVSEDDYDESGSPDVDGDDDADAVDHIADDSASDDLNDNEHGRGGNDHDTSLVASNDDHEAFAEDGDEPNENAHLYAARERLHKSQCPSEAASAARDQISPA
ncbi:ParB N-terminal domain-containing protein [Methylocella tundrae]|uniref:ParB-like N-terminal domain-containing protein n=1 Tax=Methylocella tundrae TaxID=227605 RepID=A0A4U8Z8N0_METTU|nr:ParB N-terminal domain-containing protein [Methylocella tundrae]WPP02757.1 ParB N-terminal domain-containing protein [Methylocella tundrae]VFU17520.1 conserved protein of unknown function [Methylocella tundrae]